MIARPDGAQLRYSSELVSLIRALDAACVEVDGALGYYSNRQLDEPAAYNRRESWGPWLHGNAKRLEAALSPMRAACSAMIISESAAQGLVVERDMTGDVLCPQGVGLNWPLVWRTGDDVIESDVFCLPDLAVKNKGRARAVCFASGDVFPIDDEVDSSAVLVWFRRALGRIHYEPGPYTCTLVERAYGWQAFSSER